MLRNKVIGLEGMLDATQRIVSYMSGNAFSSARVLAGFSNEDDFPEMTTLDVVQSDTVGKVVGLEGMLDATRGIPNNGNVNGFSIVDQLADFLTEDDFPEIVTLEVA